MEKFLYPFLISFFISIGLTLFFIWLSKRIKWKGRIEKRHFHENNVFRLGGVAIILSFSAGLLLDPDLVITARIWSILIAAVIILIVGTLDDRKEIFWKTQLFFQVVIAILVYVMGTRIYFITNPLGGVIQLSNGLDFNILGIVILIFWVIALTNALNWLDGIDGLAGGVTFISAMTLFLLSLSPEVYQPPVAIICLVLAGSVLGFLIFNFYPARILAGTSGSMFMGFIIAVIAVFAGAKIATALLTLAIPIVDAMWVIFERIKNKKSVFSADSRHLHYKLMKLGWSQRKIAFYYWGVTIVIALVALNTRALGKIITFSMVFIVMLIAMFVINKKITVLEKSKE